MKTRNCIEYQQSRLEIKNKKISPPIESKSTSPIRRCRQKRRDTKKRRKKKERRRYESGALTYRGVSNSLVRARKVWVCACLADVFQPIKIENYVPGRHLRKSTYRLDRYVPRALATAPFPTNARIIITSSLNYHAPGSFSVQLHWLKMFLYFP